MNKIDITTNHHARDVLWGFQLTKKERDDFSVLGENLDEKTFMRYKKRVYPINDFRPISKSSPFPSEWDGYRSDSFISGLLIKFISDCDKVVLGSC